MQPTQQNTIRRQDRWGCCPYCDLRQGWAVKVVVSPIWPHSISCPRCHQKWRDRDEFNAEAKRIIADFMLEKWDTLPDNDVTPEDRKWNGLMDDIIAERMENLRKNNWSPYEHEEDKPVQIIVPDWKGDEPDQGSVHPAPCEPGQVRVGGGRDGRGDGGGPHRGAAGSDAPDAGSDSGA